MLMFTNQDSVVKQWHSCQKKKSQKRNQIKTFNISALLPFGPTAPEIQTCCPSLLLFVGSDRSLISSVMVQSVCRWRMTFTGLGWAAAAQQYPARSLNTQKNTRSHKSSFVGQWADGTGVDLASVTSGWRQQQVVGPPVTSLCCPSACLCFLKSSDHIDPHPPSTI